MCGIHKLTDAFELACIVLTKQKGTIQLDVMVNVSFAMVQLPQ